MAAWRHTLKLADVFHNEEMPFEQRRDAIVGRIKSAKFYRPEDDFDLEDLVDQLEHAETIEAFDDYWNDFYDYCDEHRIWVDTIGPGTPEEVAAADELSRMGQEDGL